MNRTLTQMFDEFQKYWKHYVFQSSIAALTLFLLLVLLRLQNVVVVASIGSTLFIIFAMPKDITAQPRNVIGGHLVGLLSGGVCALIPHSTFVTSVLIYSVAVGISILIMVVIDVEHPPASGTALGIAYRGLSWNVVIVIVIFVVALSLVHRYCKKYIRNLV